MAIQARFLAGLVVFSSILASGAFAPSVADSVFHYPGGVEHAVAPPERSDLGRVDLFGEHPLDEAGSWDQVVPAGPLKAPPSGEADPWAEGLAESSRLGSIVVLTDPPAYPVVLNRQVTFFLNRFTGDRRELVGLWLSRATRYLGMIREVLRNRGLPEDLAFTAMIESGFNPVAVSRTGAAGLWQFMATTARHYGLRVDHWVDERMDPEKSTVAAASYFRDLYQQFGSWMLAQAAYNAGEVKVTKAIRATGSKDFWELAQSRWLRRETKEFVPQIQAATVIGRDPIRYGFELSDLSPVVVESVPVPPSTDFRRLSASSGVSIEMLRELNPTLVRGVTPPGAAYDLRVPAGTGSGVLAALDHARKTRVARSPVITGRAAAHRSEVHVVRSRDTVSSIAKQYGVSVGDVLRWNSLERQDPIRPGDRLRVTERRRSLDRERQASTR